VQLLHLASVKPREPELLLETSVFETGYFSYGLWHAHDFLLLQKYLSSYGPQRLQV